MTDKTLHLAITMAGAVSAGSYTGGVMDYLLEALEKWERAKRTGDPSVPQHRVEIDLLNGTSAGGMTAVIAAAALQCDLNPITPAHRTDQARKDANKFYNSWVKLQADNMLRDRMLDNGDIEGDRVPSLLNSKFIPEIADDIVRAGQLCKEKHPFVADELEIMVTLSNLVGLPHSIPFGPNPHDAYKASNHVDFGHFVWTEREYVPNRDVESQVALAGKGGLDVLLDPRGDRGRIPVTFKNAGAIETLKNCAMATGAFPVGLAAREVRRDRKFILENPFISLKGALDESRVPETFPTVNIDGGLLNNEPFDRAEDILYEKYRPTPQTSRQELKTLSRFPYTILMIDPFPSEDVSEDVLSDEDLTAFLALIQTATPDAALHRTARTYLAAQVVENRCLSEAQLDELLALVRPGVPDAAQVEVLRGNLKQLNRNPAPPAPYLHSLIGAIFKTMRRQLLFKPEDLRAASAPDDYSRFLIAPKRRVNGKPIQGSKAIACGALSGFGGFLDQRFREHDFYLGRMNARGFLKRHFTVPLDGHETNPIFTGGYASQAAIDRFKFQNSDGQWVLPIIPILDPTPEPELPWPTTAPEKVDELKKGFKRRIDAVLRALFKSDSFFVNVAVRLALLFFRGNVAETLLETIKKDFQGHRLFEPAPPMRDV